MFSYNFEIVNVTLRSKKNQNDPCLGSFLAIGGQNQINQYVYQLTKLKNFKFPKRANNVYISYFQTICCQKLTIIEYLNYNRSYINIIDFKLSMFLLSIVN